jgi:O-antigen biosynthesis protein
MRPMVSVIIVTHGAWHWTEQALAEVSAHTDVPYELIVVDNASQDGTPERVREQFGAVRVIRNSVNLGFGPANNQAVELARSPIIALLNSDALVLPGWFRPLADVIERDHTVGAVVPRFLHPDGRLQEAGALLASDGTVFSLGDGDDPEALDYRFPRTVDFGAAACMVIRRDSFRAVGGFDPRYAPAYYEDVDLCLRLADRGLRTAYEPRSTVVHARFGSGGSERAQALSERNRSRFVARWGAQLGSRPPTLAPPHSARRIAARDALVEGRVLVVSTEISRRDDALGHVLDSLSARVPMLRVTLAVPKAGRAADDLLARGVEIAEVSGAGLAAFSAERALHYDLVLATEAAFAEVVRESQAAASIVLLPLGAACLEQLLIAAGLAHHDDATHSC